MLVLLTVGCAPRPLIERAIRARGGPLGAITMRTAVDVHVGAPGRWEWTRVFARPDRYAWIVATAAEPHTHLFDGSTARTFIGSALVGTDTSTAAPLRSHARWAAVVNLDVLRAPGVLLEPWGPAPLPPGAVEGLAVTLTDGSRYALAFDAHARLVWMRGPLDFSPIAKDEVTARFDDFRRSDRLLLPFRTAYTIADRPLAEEQAIAICLDPPGLTPEAFMQPGLLPACP